MARIGKLERHTTIGRGGRSGGGSHPRLLVSLILFVLLVLPGCSRKAEDCFGFESTTEREECHFQHCLRIVEDEDALTDYIESISDPLSRDLLRVRLATRDPETFHWICEDASTPSGGEKCSRIVDRPHLYEPPM